MSAFKTKRRDGEQHPPEWLVESVSPVLERLESAAGVRLLRAPDGRVEVPLACGSYGCVFRLHGDDGRLMKITEDYKEGPYSAYVHMLQAGNVMTAFGPVRSVTVRIDGVWRVSDDEHRTVYAILEEKVDAKKKIPASIAEGADMYTDGWDAHDKFRKRKRPATEKEVAKADADLIGGMESIYSAGARGQAIVEFLRMVYEDGFPLTDMHHGNLCVRAQDGRPEEKEGQIVIIDFGVSRAKSPFRKSIPEV